MVFADYNYYICHHLTRIDEMVYTNCLKIKFEIYQMIVAFRFFHEKTDADFEEYSKTWDENKKRFVFLQTDLSLSQQMSNINNSMDNTKDILAVRFPTENEIHCNKIINNILLGNGVVYENNKIWYPKEVWVYSIQY